MNLGARESDGAQGQGLHNFYRGTQVVKSIFIC